MNSVQVVQKEPDGSIRANAVADRDGLERELRESGLIGKLLQAKAEAAAGESAVVVAGGRGMNGAANFRLLFELAEALGGKVGATRAAVEAGWIAYEHKIGRTGQSVSPKVYIACGVSGAVQHVAGVRADLFVAVNNDPDAPVFQVADYGIVGDAAQILPELIAIFSSTQGG